MGFSKNHRFLVPGKLVVDEGLYKRTPGETRLFAEQGVNVNRAIVCVFVLMLFLASQLPAQYEGYEVRQILQYAAINGPTDRIKDFAKSHLHDNCRLVRFAMSGEDVLTSPWVLGAPDGVMTADRFYDVKLGPDVKVSITASGSWVAAGRDGTMSNGQEVTDTARASAIYNDMYQWKNSSLSNSTQARQDEGLPPEGFFNNPDLSSSANGNTAESDEETADTASDSPQAATVTNRADDTTPPFVEKVQIIRNPDIPGLTRVYSPPSVFVGAEVVEIKVTMSEQMASAPRLNITQTGGATVIAGNTENAGNKTFTYRWAPDSSRARNGFAKLEITGEYDGNAPDYGYDLALNPSASGSNGSVIEGAMIIDTVAPQLRKAAAANGQSIPENGAVLAKEDFPKTISVFVQDYNADSEDSNMASGVDSKAISDTSRMNIQLFAPNGTEINGMVVTRPPAIELILPDVYDVANNIFNDADNDGLADPDEGTYRIEVRTTDKVGNSTNLSLNFSMDIAPVDSTDLNVSITPVFSEPTTNPDNPIGETGTFIRQLRGVEVTSTSPEWSALRSSVEIEKWVPGTIPYPTLLKTNIEKEEGKITVTILTDQDGDGVDDFENPQRGQYVPEGERDPRFGMNDGVYIIKVKAVDKAGNSADISRRITIDTTPPEIDQTFPTSELIIGPPLRMVDAMIIDPKPVSEADPSGIHFDHFNIQVEFMGNEASPQQYVRGLGFIHEPNNSDPTIPSYNPNDTNPKLLFEFTDEEGRVTPLPSDQSMDGLYTIHLAAWDKAGSEVTGSVSFTYSSTAPSSGTTSTTSAGLVLNVR